MEGKNISKEKFGLNGILNMNVQTGSGYDLFPNMDPYQDPTKTAAILYIIKQCLHIEWGLVNGMEMERARNVGRYKWDW